MKLSSAGSSRRAGLAGRALLPQRGRSGAMAGPGAAGAAAAAAEGSQGGNGRDGYDGKCVFCRIARREEPGTALLPCEVGEVRAARPPAPLPRAGPGSGLGLRGQRGGSGASAPARPGRGTRLGQRAPRLPQCGHSRRRPQRRRRGIPAAEGQERPPPNPLGFCRQSCHLTFGISDMGRVGIAAYSVPLSLSIFKRLHPFF